LAALPNNRLYSVGQQQERARLFDQKAAKS